MLKKYVLFLGFLSVGLTTFAVDGLGSGRHINPSPIALYNESIGHAGEAFGYAVDAFGYAGKACGYAASVCWHAMSSLCAVLQGTAVICNKTLMFVHNYPCVTLVGAGISAYAIWKIRDRLERRRREVIHDL